MTPIGADIPVAIGITGIALPVLEFTALEISMHLMFSHVPVALVVLGTPITVGLVPVGSLGLADSDKKDRCHENA